MVTVTQATPLNELTEKDATQTQVLPVVSPMSDGDTSASMFVCFIMLYIVLF